MGTLMFERFTDDARRVVAGARAEGQRQGVRYVGTEHLLLALLDPDNGGAGDVLRRNGLEADQVRADIARIVGPNRRIVGDHDAAALEAIGIDIEAVRAKLEEAFGPGVLDHEVPPTRHGLFGRKVSYGPFTPRSKKVLELSLREALRLKHRVIGSEHILLGLLREGEGLAAQILAERGVDFPDIRRQVEQSLRSAA
jgi:ATP-dependent Clp protease ATP-binding subunit ClpA